MGWAWFRVPVVRRMKIRTKRRSFYCESPDTALGHLQGSSSQEIRCLLFPLHPSRGRQKSCFAIPLQRQRSMMAFQLQGREIYPKPLVELPPNQIVFIVQEGARQTVGEEKNSWMLHFYNTNLPGKICPQCNSSIDCYGVTVSEWI